MRNWIISTTAVAFLAGCAVGPSYQEPEIELPEEWPEQVLLSDEERADWSLWW